MKESIIRQRMNLSQNKEKGYYKTVRINHFRSNNYIKYKSNGDRKTLSIKKKIWMKLYHT